MNINVSYPYAEKTNKDLFRNDLQEEDTGYAVYKTRNNADTKENADVPA
jgi:hypothetical protein